ncbi:TIGR02530 family flagellar biosynthesis protein [Lederbergia citrea]|uniref:TIGR02530 family flagellar biosynthesis protein n=1 Tax=Lederbergia citrea TaxID=2833581 RepID=UPI001BC9A5C4|nr:TIGR02530 family flagellar biosynthesis protein [Lederbergia citrea]MBS4203780.1 flagellar protein [Lederbergia citrea]
MKSSFVHKLQPQPMRIQPIPCKSSRPEASKDHSFSSHLEKATSAQTRLTVSKHAGIRMNERKITIEPDMWEQIDAKVNEAKQKGVNDSLVLLKNAALIVSAKNRTVVTVMDRQEAGKQIFTNIDGTIVMD